MYYLLQESLTGRRGRDRMVVIFLQVLPSRGFYQ